MSRRSAGTGPALAALALAATGCTGNGQAPASQRQVPTPSPAGRASVSSSPSRPPGDPGPDAPSVADPGPAGAGPEAGRARRSVPAEAMVGPAEAAQLLGGRWGTGEVVPARCLMPTRTVADRTAVLASGGSTVLEIVSTHRSPAAADATVADFERRLPDCGFDLGRDPRLGTASLTATSGTATLAVVAADGVTVLLLGSGSRTSGFGWSGLLDLALGTSCAAAPEGCH